MKKILSNIIAILILTTSLSIIFTSCGSSNRNIAYIKGVTNTTLYNVDIYEVTDIYVQIGSYKYHDVLRLRSEVHTSNPTDDYITTIDPKKYHYNYASGQYKSPYIRSDNSGSLLSYLKSTFITKFNIVRMKGSDILSSITLQSTVFLVYEHSAKPVKQYNLKVKDKKQTYKITYYTASDGNTLEECVKEHIVEVSKDKVEITYL